MLFGFFGSDKNGSLDTIDNASVRNTLVKYQSLEKNTETILSNQPDESQVDTLRSGNQFIKSLRGVDRKLVNETEKILMDRNVYSLLDDDHFKMIETSVKSILRVIVKMEPLINKSREMIELFLDEMAKRKASEAISGAKLMKIVQFIIESLSVVTFCNSLSSLLTRAKILQPSSIEDTFVTILLDGLNIISQLLEDENIKSHGVEHSAVFEEMVLRNSHPRDSDCVARATILLPLLFDNKDLCVLPQLTSHRDTRVAEEAINVIEQIVRCDKNFTMKIRESFGENIPVVAQVLEKVKDDIENEIQRLEEYFKAKEDEDGSDEGLLFDPLLLAQASSRKASLRLILLLTWPDREFMKKPPEEGFISDSEQICRLAFMQDILPTSLRLITNYLSLHAVRTVKRLTCDKAEMSADLEKLEMDNIVSLNSSDLVTLVRNIYRVDSVKVDVISNPTSLRHLIKTLQNIIETATALDFASYVHSFEEKHSTYVKRYCQRWGRNTDSNKERFRQQAGGDTSWYTSIPALEIAHSCYTIDVKNCLDICMNLLAGSDYLDDGGAVVNQAVGCAFHTMDLLPSVRAIRYDFSCASPKLSFYQSQTPPQQHPLKMNSEQKIQFSKKLQNLLLTDDPFDPSSLPPLELITSDVSSDYKFLDDTIIQLSEQLKNCVPPDRVELSLPSTPAVIIRLREFCRRSKWRLPQADVDLIQFAESLVQPDNSTTVAITRPPSTPLVSVDGGATDDMKSLLRRKNEELSLLSGAYRYLEKELASINPTELSIQSHLNVRFSCALQLLGSFRHHYELGNIAFNSEENVDSSINSNLNDLTTLREFLGGNSVNENNLNGLT
eukprot:GHVH01017196.1.p1 GENE.GHVH01017196.1~~GHVH01017196.1.p1  ORF type:complete len:840 (-),score=147.13 GHVH01017196.1:3471-5990(-)